MTSSDPQLKAEPGTRGTPSTAPEGRSAYGGSPPRSGMDSLSAVLAELLEMWPGSLLQPKVAPSCRNSVSRKLSSVLTAEGT